MTFQQTVQWQHSVNEFASTDQALPPEFSQSPHDRHVRWSEEIEVFSGGQSYSTEFLGENLPERTPRRPSLRHRAEHDTSTNEIYLGGSGFRPMCGGGITLSPQLAPQSTSDIDFSVSSQEFKNRLCADSFHSHACDPPQHQFFVHIHLGGHKLAFAIGNDRSGAGYLNVGDVLTAVHRQLRKDPECKRMQQDAALEAAKFRDDAHHASVRSGVQGNRTTAPAARFAPRAAEQLPVSRARIMFAGFTPLWTAATTTGSLSSRRTLFNS